MIPMKFSSALRLRSLTLLALAPLLAACGGTEAGESDGGPRVVTAIYPLQYVADRVAGEHTEVTNLTSPGVEAHDLELTVQQVATLSESDLVVYLEEFQPAVDQAVEQNGPDEVLEVTEVIDLAPGEDDHGDEDGDDEHAGEADVHAAEDDHAGESAEEHAEHAGGDPHFWLDPVLMGTVAEAFAERMGEVDPDHAADYDRTAEELVTELTELDEEYTRGLARCERDTVVVSHDAFGYLERHGLHFEPIAGLSPDSEPSPSHLAELQDLIGEEDVTTVFSETLASPALAESLAGDLGLETAVLDPIEGLTADTEGEDYLSLMRANLEKLRTANGCT